MSSFRLTVLSGLFLLFISCSEQDFYSKYAYLPSEGWSSDSVYVFSVHITDSVQAYNLYWNIRNEGTYPYQNLWLFVSQSNPDGYMQKDTLDVELMQASGKWKGTGISSLFEYKHPYKTQIVFPDTGVYKFRISQGMKEHHLGGIKNIGLSISKNGKE